MSKSTLALALFIPFCLNSVACANIETGDADDTIEFVGDHAQGLQHASDAAHGNAPVGNSPVGETVVQSDGGSNSLMMSPGAEALKPVCGKKYELQARNWVGTGDGLFADQDAACDALKGVAVSTFPSCDAEKCNEEVVGTEIRAEGVAALDEYGQLVFYEVCSLYSWVECGMKSAEKSGAQAK